MERYKVAHFSHHELKRVLVSISNIHTVLVQSIGHVTTPKNLPHAMSSWTGTIFESTILKVAIFKFLYCAFYFLF